MHEFPDNPNIENLTEVTGNLLDIINNSHEGVLVVDNEGNVIFANKALLNYQDVGLEEMKGRPFIKFLSRDEAATFDIWFRETLANEDGNSQTMIFHNEIQDTYLESIFRRKNDGRNQAILYFRDITQRVRIEQQLLERNTFYNGLIDSSVDGIIAADMEGNIILFNKGAQELLGYTEKEALETLHTTKLYPEGTAREIMRRMRSENFGGKGKSVKHRVIGLSKDGEEIPISLSGSLILDRENHEIASVGIFTDLRQIEKMQQKLTEKQMELIQSEKMASLGKLAAGVAHEINNPLSGVVIYANLVMEELPENSQMREDVERIVSETTRCKTIVRELLDFARGDDADCEAANVNRLIKEGIRLLHSQSIFHNIEIDLDLESDIPSVNASAVRLNQVIWNLTLNAAEAMSGGGILKIQTQHLPMEDTVRIIVSDTGCGIPKEIQSKIFDPFFTTKEIGKGTGLGLSICYRILKDCGGTIEVESGEGKGTTFRIDLPALIEGEKQQVTETS